MFPPASVYLLIYLPARVLKMLQIDFDDIFLAAH